MYVSKTSVRFHLNFHLKKQRTLHYAALFQEAATWAERSSSSHSYFSHYLLCLYGNAVFEKLFVWAALQPRSRLYFALLISMLIQTLYISFLKVLSSRSCAHFKSGTNLREREWKCGVLDQLRFFSTGLSNEVDWDISCVAVKLYWIFYAEDAWKLHSKLRYELVANHWMCFSLNQTFWCTVHLSNNWISLRKQKSNLMTSISGNHFLKI